MEKKKLRLCLFDSLFLVMFSQAPRPSKPLDGPTWPAEVPWHKGALCDILFTWGRTPFWVHRAVLGLWEFSQACVLCDTRRTMVFPLSLDWLPLLGSCRGNAHMPHACALGFSISPGTSAHRVSAVTSASDVASHCAVSPNAVRIEGSQWRRLWLMHLRCRLYRSDHSLISGI